MIRPPSRAISKRVITQNGLLLIFATHCPRLVKSLFSIKRKTLTALPIYLFFEKKLEALREYIDKNLIKEYIRPSKSFIRYTVFFVSKKNGKLRIYVDYRKLNDIIIKNRYTLPLIHEI
jgi:hypothetical protein